MKTPQQSYKDKIYKVKIIKVMEERRYVNDYDESPAIYAGITKWDELTWPEFEKLNNAVNDANRSPDNKFHLFIIQQQEDYEEIFDSAKEFVEYEAKQKTKREQQDAEYKRKKAEAAEKRKQNRMEKLKRELEKLEGAINGN